MRLKDEFKQDALMRATVKLVNEVGFVSSSVTKIAKQAEISPATLYIYYENKDDLLISTFVAIKTEMARALVKGVEKENPIRLRLRQVWTNTFKYITKNPAYFQFTEQFANSPYFERVNQEEINKDFKPIIEIFNDGIEQQIIKNVSYDILSAFVFHPILNLANPKKCADFKINEDGIETAFSLAWDAIKL